MRLRLEGSRWVHRPIVLLDLLPSSVHATAPRRTSADARGSSGVRVPSLLPPRRRGTAFLELEDFQLLDGRLVTLHLSWLRMSQFLILFISAYLLLLWVPEGPSGRSEEGPASLWWGQGSRGIVGRGGRGGFGGGGYVHRRTIQTELT